MKIINPLYDKAFKYLMENDKLARKVLSVILDVEVEEVALGQQETVFPDEKRKLTLFRLDFTATIREADGSRKTVLIELQKSKFPTDIQRFRNYLASGNSSKKKTESLVGEPEPEYGSPHPIITIYILGYNLDDLPYLAVTVNRDIVNSVNKEKINVKSFFIEHLTHRSHIIQVRRLPEKRYTRLEKFLTLFNQAWCTEEGYIIDLVETPEEFSDIARYLQGPVMDEEFRRNLEVEEEIDFIFEEQELKFLKKIAEAENREEEERRLKEDERRQKNALAVKLAKQLRKSGLDIDEIAQETGLNPDTIINL